jgi:hypothetical protein
VSADDEAVFEQRANELATKAGITLDREECPPEWSDFMDAARSDVLLQRGIAHVRTKGLPEELSDYLARTWITHVETFERCRTEGDVTMAASWARRHAKVAAAVLAMPSLGVSGEDRSEPTPAPAEWVFGFAPQGAESAWRCQRCREVMRKNQRACPACAYTVFDPVHREVVTPEGTS